MSFLEKIQNKPHYIRIQILWILVILVMAIIIFFWIIFLKSSLGLFGNKEKISQEERSIPSLFNTLKEDFSFLKKSLKAEVDRVMGGADKNSNDNNKFEIEIIAPSKLPE